MRAIDARRDMAALADLMEAGFGSDLDVEGRRLIQEMRAFGRAGWLGWLFGRFFLPPAAYPLGFVWHIAGRLVGNASILPVDRGARRWVIANVAVLPDFRRRGIGRAMVDACVELARRGNADEVMLQVEPDNDGAVQLYERLGFSTASVRTSYRRPAAIPVGGEEPSPSARLRRPAEWRQHFHLAVETHPEGMLWPFPLQARLFREAPLAQALGLAADRHWVWSEGGKLIAGLTAQPDWNPATWRLILVVRPEGRGRVEADLLGRALADAVDEHGALLDYTAGAAVESLQALGFRAERTLAWMRLDLAPDSRQEA
jgi:ribosomal protein S18 acetylase RimI-like enzyme